MLRYARNIAFALRGKGKRVCGLNSPVIFTRSISTTLPNFKNPLDRLLSKPLLYDEDTDDELDDDLRPRESMTQNDPFAESDDDQEGDDIEIAEAPQLRVGKELLKLGRVPYRHIEKLPDWISQRKQEISDYRTPNQIRRCLKNWMLKPDRELQRKYARRNLGWMDTAPSDGAKEASRVMPYGPEETVAYLNYFFPSRFAITKRVLTEVKTLLPKFRPVRIVDFGCGPATAAAAAVEVWGAGVVQRYSGVDMSQSMLDAAGIMTTDMGRPLPQQGSEQKTAKRTGVRHTGSVGLAGPRVDVSLSTKTVDILSRIAAGAGSDEHRFDMAVCSYTLSELTSDAVKRAAVQVLYESLDVNGVMVIIDNGSPVGSHHTRSARKMLLDLFGSSDSPAVGPKNKEIRYVLQSPRNPDLTYEDFEVSVLAPCTHDGQCPLKPGAWCSFPQRSHSSAIRKGSEEKFSYVVLQKRLRGSGAQAKLRAGKTGSSTNGEDEWLWDSDRMATSTRDPTPLATMKRFLDHPGEDTDDLVEELIDEVDWEDYNPPLFRQEYGRIIRSPIKAKKHVVMDVCQSDGVIARSTVSKASAWKVPTLYSAVRKLRWGGLVPVLPLQSGEVEASQSEMGPDSPSSALTSSPMSRAGGMRLREVRRDLVPERQEKEKVWGEGEGRPARMDRNRLYRGEGEEMYEYVDSDEERMEAEDPIMNDPELKDTLKDLEGINKKVKQLEHLQELQKRMERGDELLPEEIEELQRANAEKQRRLASGEEVEELTRYEDLDEDSKRLLDVPEQDWQDWLAALEGDEEKGRDLSALLGKRYQEEKDEMSGEGSEDDENFDPIASRRLRGKGRGKLGRQQELPSGADSTRVAGSSKVAREPMPPSSQSASKFSNRLQQAETQVARVGGDVAEDIERMKAMMSGRYVTPKGRGGGRRKPAVAKAAASIRRPTKEGE